MGLPDELLKLEQLRQKGTLSNAEFAQAKAALLTAPYACATDDSAELVKEAELAKIDQEWEMERSKFLVKGNVPFYGGMRNPSRIQASVNGLMVSGVGVFATFKAFELINITNQNTGGNQFLVRNFILPLSCIIFTLVYVRSAVNDYKKAIAYETAYKAYLERRSKVQ
jgi:hypothetical protein